MVSKIEINEETFEMHNRVLAILKDGSSFGVSNHFVATKFCYTSLNSQYLMNYFTQQRKENAF